MGIFSGLKRLLSGLEDSIYRNHSCISCGREILDGTKFSICNNCKKNLVYFKGNLCQKCGDFVNGDNLFCVTCQNKIYDFNKSNSLVVYNDEAASIVKGLKYSGYKFYSKIIAEMMTEDRSLFEGIDFITFVPIGKKRMHDRGFNQAEEIARQISKIVNIPVLPLLEKIGNEKHQAGLSREKRLENLAGTFEIKKDNLPFIQNKVVIIIDDVFTTGATLSECTKVFLSNKKIKPKRVNCFTFAKTELNSINNG